MEFEDLIGMSIHGVDANLGENIRVTVIATGFAEHDNSSQDKGTRVYDLESNQQINMFSEEKKDASENTQKGYSFQNPSTATSEQEEKREFIFEVDSINKL